MLDRLSTLDDARGGPLDFRHGRVVVRSPHPRQLPWAVVAICLVEPGYFHHHVLGERLNEITYGGLLDAMDFWRVHHDLPEFHDVRRLAYLVDRYHDDAEYDLLEIHGLRLGDLWREREWRLLLNLLDRLPHYSATAQAIAEDDEHVTLIAQAIDARGEEERPSGGVSVRGFTPVVAELRGLTNEIRAYRYEFASANVEKGRQIPRPEYLPGPVTASDRARALVEKRAASRAGDRLRELFFSPDRLTSVDQEVTGS